MITSASMSKASAIRATESSSILQTMSSHRELSADMSTCAPMQNMITHFTVDVQLGDPEQTLSVIADTGSDTLVVVDYSCIELGACNANSKCYFGWNQSSTFSLSRDPNGGRVVDQITYGSGSIMGVIANEKVGLGGLYANITDGVFLIAQSALTLGEDTVFEGILGLGMPAKAMPEEAGSDSEDATSGYYSSDSEDATYGYYMADAMDEVGSSGGGDDSASRTKIAVSKGLAHGDYMGDVIRSVEDSLEQDMERSIEISVRRALAERPSSRINGKGRTHTLERGISTFKYGGTTPRSKTTMLQEGSKTNDAEEPESDEVDNTTSGEGVLWQAGVERFEMCFNLHDGALRLNQPKPTKTLSNVGTYHWGMGLSGVRVGDEVMPMCNNLTHAGQATPCAVIPDSGTTLITAPAEHLALLFETLCDQWDRCRENHTALERAKNASEEAAIEIYGINPFEIDIWAKWQTFKLLLADCGRWSSSTEDLAEMPTLEFAVTGNKGETETLEFSPWSYIFESEVPADENVSSVLKKTELLKSVGMSSSQSRWPSWLCWMNPGSCKSDEFAWPEASNGTDPSASAVAAEAQAAEASTSSRETLRVCEPGFGTMEYTTRLNGPVWILGTGLFYEYAVGFELDANGMAMSFQKLTADSPCESCGAPQASLAQSKSPPRPIRRLNRPPRQGKYDTSKP